MAFLFLGLIAIASFFAGVLTLFVGVKLIKIKGVTFKKAVFAMLIILACNIMLGLASIPLAKYVAIPDIAITIIGFFVTVWLIKATFKASILRAIGGYLLSILFGIALAVCIALPTRTFLIQAFKIPTGSMRPTFMQGDSILVNKFIYKIKKPERGDVIVFKYPEDKRKPFVFRIVGMPEESLQIKLGKIYINGALLEKEAILGERYYYNKENTLYGEEGKKIQIPKNHYFVLGDNSASARDSRYWGFVPEDDITGKAILIYLPPTRAGKIK